MPHYTNAIASLEKRKLSTSDISLLVISLVLGVLAIVAITLRCVTAFKYVSRRRRLLGLNRDIEEGLTSGSIPVPPPALPLAQPYNNDDQVSKEVLLSKVESSKRGRIVCKLPSPDEYDLEDVHLSDTPMPNMAPKRI